MCDSTKDNGIITICLVFRCLLYHKNFLLNVPYACLNAFELTFSPNFGKSISGCGVSNDKDADGHLSKFPRFGRSASEPSSGRRNKDDVINLGCDNLPQKTGQPSWPDLRPVSRRKERIRKSSGYFPAKLQAAESETAGTKTVVTLQPDLKTVEKWSKPIVLQSKDKDIHANSCTVKTQVHTCVVLLLTQFVIILYLC